MVLQKTQVVNGVTFEAIFMCHYNFQITCAEFYNCVKVELNKKESKIKFKI